MRKNIVKFAVICMVLALLSSCASVRIQSWKSSEVTLHGIETIAIQTTKVNPKILDDVKTSSIVEDVASYTTKILEKSLDQGVFKIINSKDTDTLVRAAKRTGDTIQNTLSSKGVDAILTSSIDSMTIDEYISCYTKKIKEDDGTESTAYYYYLNQRCCLTMSYMLQSVETKAILDSGTLKSTYPLDNSYTQSLVKVEVVKSDEKTYCTYEGGRTSFNTSSFTSIVDSFYKTIRNRLTPYVNSSYISLMANKNKLESVKEATKLASQGYYQAALTIFEKEYESSKDTASGYNASVMYFALGQYEKAMNLAYEVAYSETDLKLQSKAFKLYYKMQSIYTTQLEALSQIEETKSTEVYSETNDLVGF